MNPADDAWHMLAALAATDGSAAHPRVAALAAPAAARRDVADAVHAVCTIHGRYLFEDTALARDEATADWFARVTTAFTNERAYLAHLTAAVGPLPSTPGQAQADAAFASQRHAFDMLARSDRKGCALGAAVALVLDWEAIRTVLDAAAARFGVAVPPSELPDRTDLAAFVATVGDSPAIRRAIAFGAQQVFAQHRGLWSLLEARASARDHHG
ncbi:hypothetical protein [Sphingomonas sp. NFR15]|uniref:DUF6975 family protein n=1 Tax=Sphingomonas sp. NFR15 TaxID=1566282 RepID=UPI000887F88C|nr:hypothetical protein [Sphingomonas sp. NFR15]SDA29766.1 hypothetical protein SAMN03159340_02421 [Sphingomonas sp. NFR15]